MTGVILKKDYNETYAQVTIEGKVYKNIPLSAHEGSEIIEIRNKYGVNIITVEDN